MQCAEFFLDVCYMNTFSFSILVQRNQKGGDEIVVALVFFTKHWSLPLGLSVMIAAIKSGEVKMGES